MKEFNLTLQYNVTLLLVLLFVEEATASMLLERALGKEHKHKDALLPLHHQHHHSNAIIRMKELLFVAEVIVSVAKSL